MTEDDQGEQDHAEEYHERADDRQNLVARSIKHGRADPDRKDDGADDRKKRLGPCKPCCRRVGRDVIIEPREEKQDVTEEIEMGVCRRKAEVLCHAHAYSDRHSNQDEYDADAKKIGREHA